MQTCVLWSETKFKCSHSPTNKSHPQTRTKRNRHRNRNRKSIPTTTWINSIPSNPHSSIGGYGVARWWRWGGGRNDDDDDGHGQCHRDHYYHGGPSGWCLCWHWTSLWARRLLLLLLLLLPRRWSPPPRPHAILETDGPHQCIGCLDEGGGGILHRRRLVVLRRLVVVLVRRRGRQDGFLVLALCILERHERQQPIRLRIFRLDVAVLRLRLLPLLVPGTLHHRRLCHNTRHINS